MKSIKLTVIVLFLSIQVLFGKILKVPQEYSTIQSAINASNNLDTVLVSEGTYYENVKYNGKNVVLASNYIFTKDFQTIKNTIINGSKSTNPEFGSCVAFYDKETSDAVLEGFTLTGGFGTRYNFSFGPYQEGGGVTLNYSSGIIRNNIIINNNIKNPAGVARGGGGGIASMYGNPTIYNNIIACNDGGYAGGIVLNWSSGKITNNIICNNIGGAAFGTGGIMIWEPTTDVIVANNTVVGNISLKDAGGININSKISVVKNNIVWGNHQVTGPQVTNADRGSYNNIEDYSDANNISANPLFLENSFLLSDNSPCIDAGDPADSCKDAADSNNPGKPLPPSKGGLRNDIGAFGGSLARILPELDLADIYAQSTNINFTTRCIVSKEYPFNDYLLNMNTGKLTVDSVSHINKTDYHINYSPKTLSRFQSDTLKIVFKPTAAGSLSDTIKIHFHTKDSVYIKTITIKGNAFVDVKEYKSILNKYELYQNYPNPFNPETTIKFSLKENVMVSLKVYNILGEVVETLLNKDLKAGTYSINWKPNENVSSGVYFSKLIAGNFSEVKKMIYQR